MMGDAMTHDDAFLQAIIERPAADAPRLNARRHQILVHSEGSALSHVRDSGMGVAVSATPICSYTQGVQPQFAGAQNVERREDGGGIRSGIRVFLKSGGPSMTVDDIGRETGVVVCRWEKADGSPGVSAFPPVCLTLTDPGL